MSSSVDEVSPLLGAGSVGGESPAQLGGTGVATAVVNDAPASCFPLGDAQPDRPAGLNTLIEWAGFVQAVAWLTMAGFGPPWALLSILRSICLTFYADTTAGAVNSKAYFYAQLFVPLVFALGRTAIILHVTFLREAARRKARMAGDEFENEYYVSHREFWWTRRRFGLPLSCIFEFGDGMGRVWAIASVLDEFTRLYVASLPDGLFVNSVYVAVCLTIAVTSGMLRLVWWIWYWETFSARDPNILPISTELHPELHTPRDEKAASPNTSTTLSKKVKVTTRPVPAIASVYPQASHSLPNWLRTGAKKVYSFMDGFGRTWAVFAVFNAVIEYETREDRRAFSNDAYFWCALGFAAAGGLYVVVMRTYKRFKVFLH